MPTDRPSSSDASREPIGHDGPVGRSPGGQELRELRRRAAAAARDVWGRGPERCEAHWAGANLLVVSFHGGLTAAELSLKAAGDLTEVERSRENFRRALEPHLAAAAQESTGRRVAGALGASRLDPDVTIAALLMAPVDSKTEPGSPTERLAQDAERARERAEERIAESSAVVAQAEQAARRRSAIRRGKSHRSKSDDADVTGQ